VCFLSNRTILAHIPEQMWIMCHTVDENGYFGAVAANLAAATGFFIHFSSGMISSYYAWNQPQHNVSFTDSCRMQPIMYQKEMEKRKSDADLARSRSSGSGNDDSFHSATA